MKKFIIAVCIVVALALAWNVAYYRLGIYIDFHPDKPVTSLMKAEGKTIYMYRDGAYEPFEIRGVDMGVGIPGEWATDYAVDKETYLRWFEEIQAMGANTVRVYTILHDDFYNAFYEYNRDRDEPLYLLHGVWVNDYLANSHRDAYNAEIIQTLEDDCKTLVDIIHGNKTVSLGYGLGSGSYRRDISQWVIGYIVGIGWESGLVAYTNQKSADLSGYTGTYLCTTDDATPFEAMLCRVGDEMIGYESHRYKQQRLLAFTNWPTTDPFTYSFVVTAYYDKIACVDVEHIKGTDDLISGMFASYHVYPYYTDYLAVEIESRSYTQEEIDERYDTAVRRTIEYRLAQLNAPYIGDYSVEADFIDADGNLNSYLAYLRALNRYHTIPVVISEYGVTTGRGMAQRDVYTGRNQGYMTEQEQGQALVSMYRDIMDAGCAGSCVFSWQDEWFKRTWNTMHAVDLDKTPYWSDFQTNEQYFGLLTFDPGDEQSICYVDGDTSEWGGVEPVASFGDTQVSVMYDEKFLYFLVKKEGFDAEKDVLYIPIDTTQKSGSTYCENYGVSFERASDFLIVIDGAANSRVLVQKRYEALLSTYASTYYAYDPYMDPPASDTPVFERIYLPLKLYETLPSVTPGVPVGEKYETGLLRYGNANPSAENFDSLADFIISGDWVELRIPWQLLNFSNPSEMMIHDDYFENYGIENIHIDGIYVGAGSSAGDGGRIRMAYFPLKGWGKKVTAHERLKGSYYILKDYWTGTKE